MHHAPTRAPIRFGMPAGLVAVCLLVAGQSGCTSALTTASLTNGLWQGADHAAEPEPPAAAVESAEDDVTQTATVADTTVDDERREAALEEAMERLSRLGGLDPAVEAALVATLQRTQPEDWPVVVDELAASLPTARTTADEPLVPPADADTATPMPVADQTVMADAMTTAADPSESTTEHSAASSEDAAVVPADAEAEQLSEAFVPTPSPAIAGELTVRSACFASAVRAWGDVDRFATDRFRPGQEVIVYVELDNLTIGPSPAGHTTCVDTVLRLADEADRTLHTWTFEPIAETCAGRRRDYFARYVVRIPESAPPGGCRVDVSITDTLGGATAQTALPLEIAAAD